MNFMNHTITRIYSNHSTDNLTCVVNFNMTSNRIYISGHFRARGGGRHLVSRQKRGENQIPVNNVTNYIMMMASPTKPRVHPCVCSCIFFFSECMLYVYTCSWISFNLFEPSEIYWSLKKKKKSANPQQ